MTDIIYDAKIRTAAGYDYTRLTKEDFDRVAAMLGSDEPCPIGNDPDRDEKETTVIYLSVKAVEMGMEQPKLAVLAMLHGASQFRRQVKAWDEEKGK